LKLSTSVHAPTIWGICALPLSLMQAGGMLWASATVFICGAPRSGANKAKSKSSLHQIGVTRLGKIEATIGFSCIGKNSLLK
jgi:hypothetical protein